MNSNNVNGLAEGVLSEFVIVSTEFKEIDKYFIEEINLAAGEITADIEH